MDMDKVDVMTAVYVLQVKYALKRVGNDIDLCFIKLYIEFRAV